MKKIIRLFFLIFYYFFAQYLPDSSLPIIGKVCNQIRIFCCKYVFKYAGKIATVNKNAHFGNGSDIELGDNSGLGRNFCVQQTNVKIGENVMIASNVSIIGGGHVFTRTDIPIIQQGNLPKSNLIIENDVWIGANVLILGKTEKIGKGAIIGAGSVVTKEVPCFTIAAGNPAVVIKKRH